MFKAYMTRNPLINALAAFLYIVFIASFLFWAAHSTGLHDSILIPVVMLSLFVLSAAMMGYIFLCQPILLFFEEEKELAVRLFLATVGIFACITLILSAVLFLEPV